MKLYITRNISAAHFLPDYEGACRNLHGHSFRCEVWLEGLVDTMTGMLVDFKQVKDIIDRLDHVCLNDVLPSNFLPPTAENIALYLYDEIPSCVKVRVWESSDCYAETGR